jgi:regulator of sirC expression with transglutaminase-like and TPR domain
MLRWNEARPSLDPTGRLATPPPMTSPQGIPEPTRPSLAQIRAAIALLGDDRGPLLEAARERLLRWGDCARPQLLEAAEADHLLTRLRARSVLRDLEVRDCLRRFGQLRLGSGGRQQATMLLDGAMLLSQMVRTFVPETAELATRLRILASHLRKECAGRSLPFCARLLAERLHGELGLHGADPGALDLDHVLIDRVLEQRCGVPVTLSLVYLLVARWAGLSAAGVAMPDHFLVRLHGARAVLVDPFHGGRTVTKTDCARHLRANGHGRVRDRLRDLTDREVLIQYLRCLQRAANHRAVPEARRTLGRAMELLETN